MTRKYLTITCLIPALVLVLAGAALAASAAPIGRFLHLEGQVDLLKGGKIPAVAAKITTPVEAGDVIRTKSKSRAQVLFVDDTVLTLAPESQVAVADYLYDQDQGRRRALLRVFRGLAHTVVKKILVLEAPDFLMQTQTVVIGVRGTEWYTLILPNRTNVYNIQGLLELRSTNRDILGSILLESLQYREIRRDEPPGPAQEITPAILSALRRMMYAGPGEIPPEITGGPRLLPEVDRLKLPEAITSPYAPSLSPVHPGRAPAQSPGTVP